MQISYEAQLIILGATITLISSLIIIFVKDWVSARRKNIERKEEEKEKQDEIIKTAMLYLQAKGMMIIPKEEDGEIIGFTIEERSK